MHIFLKLGIVEHTGHGIPVFVEKYGREVFDIHDSSVNVIIPFNKKVNGNNASIWQKRWQNLINEKLTENEKQILLELINNPSAPYNQLVIDLKISRRTVSRVFASLVEKGFIERIGTNKMDIGKSINNYMTEA